MDRTSVEDFQDYHNWQPDGLGEIPDSLLDPHDNVSHIHHDLDDDEASLSGSAHHSPDEAVFDHATRTSSPRTSNGSDDDELSILESHDGSDYKKPSPITPNGNRPVFRNPSSVRAMQMDTTPPHLASPGPQQRQKLYTPSRQCTPRSARSHRSVLSSPSKLSPSKKMRKEFPLILLHVTLLPIPLVYSQEIMESVLPPSMLENWKLLQEKATDTVLDRGILIPHPKEDYDLLEERLLESLELKMPRILKCGHFHLSPEEEADIAPDSDDDDLDTDATDLDICVDCGRRIRDGKYGSTGTGNKRWDIKLFAANGLMRAGAWSAAWREMERVDVEILPWMEEDMKRELELRREGEARARNEVREDGVGGLDDERLREIYGGEAQAFVDGLIDETPATAEMAARESQSVRRQQKDVPLWDLLRHYLCHVARDRRNIAIVLLSILVLFLSFNPFGSRSANAELQSPQSNSQSNHAVPPVLSTRSLSRGPEISSTQSAPVIGTISTRDTSSAAISASAIPQNSKEVRTPEPVSPTEDADDEISEILED